MGHQNFEEIMGVTASLVMTSELVTLRAALSITDIPAIRTDCLFSKSPKSALAPNIGQWLSDDVSTITSQYYN
jgi:hypothetical protein